MTNPFLFKVCKGKAVIFVNIKHNPLVTCPFSLELLILWTWEVLNLKGRGYTQILKPQSLFTNSITLGSYVKKL